MNLQNLSKEHKQYLVLGAMALAALGYGAYFGIQFSLSSISKAKDELADLVSKIERADRMLAAGENTSEEYTQSVGVLKGHFEDVPPEQNYYSWATEIILEAGHSTGLEIDVIDEVRQAKSKEDHEKEGLRFESYSLKITAQGSYDDTKEFLRFFEREHPLVRVFGLEINTGKNQEMHNVQLFVQWPSHMGEVISMWEEIEQKQQSLAGRIPKTKETSKEPAETVAPATVETPKKPAPKKPVVVEPKVETPVPVVATTPTKPAPRPVAVAKPAPKKPVVVEPKVETPVPVVATTPTKPAPRPVAVAKPAPKKPVVVEPKVETPVPVVATTPTKPAPRPVAVAKPAPEEPVVVEPKVETPVPVVATTPTKPAPRPVAVAKPAPKKPVAVEPKVETPVPVVVTTPTKPAPRPVAVAKSALEPKVEEPAPVVVATPTKPAPKNSVAVESKVEPTSDKQEGNMGSILAMLDGFESEPAKPEASTPQSANPEPEEPISEESRLKSLLASLDSQGESKPAPETSKSSTDPAALVALVMELESASEPPAQPKVAVDPEPVPVVEPEPKVEESEMQPSNSGETYVSTAASSQKLADLLRKDEPKAEKTLGSFLDGMMEDINDE